MALRCLYSDLDGTLLGKRGSLFADETGEFSLMQARMLEACHRAGVEVVIVSGRREIQVHEDARLMGQTSYIYEVGCAFVIDGEKTLLTGEWQPNETGSIYDQITALGLPQMLFDHFPGRLEYHEPWHSGRELSHLFRGSIDVEEGNRLLHAAGHDNLRLLDNGSIHRKMPGIEQTKAYHLVPLGVSKAHGIAAHMRARGYRPEECIAAGDSVEDLGAAEAVGRFYVVANGPEKDPKLREALSDHDNITVTEARNGAGVYEAVVGHLMQSR
ncbi:MAG TPA: HAD family hydrolase [Solirubrobacterales bacterium]|nr:HAD family hydrolase [Solirubrobacterales bacterium]